MRIRSTKLQVKPTAKPAPASATATPAPKPSPSAADSNNPLDLVDIEALKELAGVKAPSFIKKMINTGTTLLQGINLALAIGPTVGHLILAREIAKVQAKSSGKPELSPMDWLRENRPGGFQSSLFSVMHAGSGLLQTHVGLSLSDLSTVEEHYYRTLAPTVNSNGIKTTAPFLRELAKTGHYKPGQARSAFVFLGQDKAEEAKSVTDLWNSKNRPPKNPFSTLDPRRLIWNSLKAQAKKGELPIFVDMDNNYSSNTGTELIAHKTLSSLGERNNSLGDDFADTSRYFRWLTERQESFSGDLEPYFAQKNPETSATVAEVKGLLTPPWLDGREGMGPWTAPEKMRELPAKFAQIKEQGGENAWLDSLIALDRDVLTGVQTYWIKLLRELKRPDRTELLKPLPETMFNLNLLAPGEEGFEQVAPADGPDLSEIVPSKGIVAKRRAYDRAVSLKELLDHSLDGLGIEERRQMLGDIKGLARKNAGRLEQREQRLREALGEQYGGLDIRSVIDGNMPAAEFKERIAELRDAGDKLKRTPAGAEARRHGKLLEFVYAMDTRYGEVDQILPRIKGDFSQHPLGVSEFFIPPEAGAKVTPLRETDVVSIKMGNSQDPEPMKMSMVLEGGGGRGFAYVECLKQLEGAFAQSANGYEIDEYVGTSAGSILATLLAAGYEADELREVIESIDFTSFNGDAAWLMGGVDPKVRGVNRTGIFSTQKLYQTFSDLLAKKLGVEGRPVLFSDLPHKLKLVVTVFNTDMDENNPLYDTIDGDGRFVFSNEKTPNFDVIGAMAASSSIPAFFQLPQILMAKPNEDGTTERARMQLADGGVVDNMSLSTASREEEKRALMVLPSHTDTKHPVTGEWVGLSTLNFSTDNLDLVDAHNRKLYSKFAPKLDDYFQKMKTHGVERAVVGFTLTKPWQQDAPIVQGSSEALSLQSIIHANEIELPIMDKEDGDGILHMSQRPPDLLPNVVAGLFDRYMDDRPGVGDGSGNFHRNEDGFHYHPPKHETPDIFEMAWSVGGCGLAHSKSEYKERKFQQD